MSWSRSNGSRENPPGVDREFPGLTAADAWNPAEFGEVLHKADARGQLGLFEWEVNEPPEPDDYRSTEDFRRAYDIWDLKNCVHSPIDKIEEAGVNDAEFSGTDTEPVGDPEIALGAGVHHSSLDTAEPDGDSGRAESEALGSEKCDRLLDAAGDGQAGAGRHLPNQSIQLAEAPNITPQATFNDEQPPNRGDGRSRISSIEPAPPHFKPGTTVGHKSGAHLGGIEKIYYSDKRRKWRARIGPVNYDLDNLVEQKVLPWDLPKPLGNWIETGTMTLHSDACTIWTRKLPATQKMPTENWALAELVAKPIWQLKAIAKRCCEHIPGGHPRTKRAYIRAILAEQELLSRRL